MGESAYRDVANAIRADIEARRLMEGDRLPTVRELAQRFGVPTGTVSKAVDILRADGALVSRHGRGGPGGGLHGSRARWHVCADG